ncbi:cysteine-rich CWC family protein [uncultured Draconibacterium sp.]|uniref:cysteine-rich CWC family protein n=1 Tax=uncultured Draconibacterium sp. TaxID=1573823 RepID=UPI0029C98ABF|nr:cysteine-rich CWC family protein [uncultured Draconibacterium sp.]
MMEHNPKYEPHACAKCGNLHTCTGNYHCWCAQADMPDKVRDYIMACFDGCLCPKCIEELKRTII